VSKCLDWQAWKV